MKITFYILIKGRRPLRFDSASLLADYVKGRKISSKALIEMRNDDKPVGIISIKKYLELEKSTK